MTDRSAKLIGLVLSAVLTIALFQNCGIEKPKLENASFASAIYPHTGDEISCSTCHETARPHTSSNFSSLNPSAPFDYGTHGSGFDCISCHSTQVVGIRQPSDWAPGFFLHVGTLNNCQTCHEAQRPTGTINGFPHGTQGVGDCVSCHQKSFSSSFASMSDWSGATAAPPDSKYDMAHDLNLTTYIPTYSGTTIISPFTVQTQTLHMTMNHSSSALSTGTLQTCTTCHAGASQGSYLPGVMHASLTAAGISQPTTCTSCHGSIRPSGFVGTIAGETRSPSGPAMKHDAVVWSASNGVYSATSTPLVTSDCVLCHTAGTSWTNGIYHNSLLSQPSSCLDCHANSRPSGTVPSSPVASVSQFDHSNGGMGDCISCHTSKTTWVSGGKFHLTAGTQTTCVSCHSSERPSSSSFTIGGTTTAFGAYDAFNKPFDVATHGGSLDCVSCHASPPASTTPTITQWRGANFNHAANAPIGSCVSCHSSQRPAGTVGPIGNTMNHALNGQGDCVGCHQASITASPARTFASMGDWSGGVGQPTGLVGSHKFSTTLSALRLNLSSTASPLIPKYVSSTSVISQPGLIQGMVHSAIPAALNPTVNCTQCHASLPTSYSGGVFHSVVTANSITLTSCSACHTSSMPTDIIDIASAGTTLGTGAIRPMNHIAKLTSGLNVAKTASLTGIDTGLGSVDCTTCHKQPGVSGGFNDGKFHSNVAFGTISNCTTCHYVIMPSALTNKMAHKSTVVTQDCVACHTTAPTAGQITAPASTNWGSALFHNNVTTQPTACLECHSAQLPATTKLSGNAGQYMNHSSTAAAGKDCAVCHTSDLSLSPRAWSTTDRFHSFVTPVACNGCHGLTNGSTVAGTGNNIPAGLTNSHTTTTASVTSGVSGQLDKVDHRAPDVASKECNICHTVAGSTIPAGSISPAWNNADFHANVSSVTGSCVTCHSNIMPTAVVSGMDHSTIGTSDCASCHTTNGTGGGTTGLNPNWLGAQNGGPHTYAFLTTQASSCVSCHKLDGASKTLAVSAPLSLNITQSTTVATPSAGTAGINFTHSWTATSTGTKANNLTMCLGCHATAATNALGPALNGMGIYDSTVGAKGTKGWGSYFVSPSTTPITTSGTFNHSLPSNVTYSQAGGPVVTATAAVNSCLPCHATRQPPTNTWYPNSTANDRFSHDATWSGMNDCVACHTKQTTKNTAGNYTSAFWLSPSTQPSGTIAWATGHFNHLSTSGGQVSNSTCVNCHTGTSSSGFYSHSNASGSRSSSMPCMACHGTTAWTNK